MSIVIERSSNADASKVRREFIGRAWENTSKKDGTTYFRCVIDRNITKLNLTPETPFILWPNKKREGKQDADFRISLIIPEDAE
jgi:uncharacterized protein (DUF736 family)